MNKNILISVKLTLSILFLSVFSSVFGQTNDIGVDSITSPTTLCTSTVGTIEVDVSNYGTNQIDSFMVVWSIDNVLDSNMFHTLIDTLNGVSPSTINISLGNVAMQGLDVQIEAWTKWPNGTLDSQLANDSAAINVVNFPLPVACFYDSTSYLTSVFKNFSKNFTSNLWDFGDGTASVAVHPTHIFPWTANTTNYNVLLTVYNACGEDTISRNVKASSYPGTNNPNHINYSANGLSVNFWHWFAYGNPSNPVWDFGDGSTSTTTSPTHVYNIAGAYECFTVRLGVDLDCGRINHSRKIAVGNYPASNPCNIINGVKDINKESNIQVYPNPNNGIFNVEVKANKPSELSIEVLDIRGVLVYAQKYGKVQGEVNKSINLDLVTPGIYLIKIVLNEGSEFIRVLVH